MGARIGNMISMRRIVVISLIISGVSGTAILLLLNSAAADIGYPDDLWPEFTARYREVATPGEHAGVAGSAVYELVFESRSSWTRVNIQHSDPDRQGSQQSFVNGHFAVTRSGFPAIQTSYPEGEYASPGYWLVLWETAFDRPLEANSDTTKYSQVFPCGGNAPSDCRLTRTVTLDTESNIPLWIEEDQDGELVYLFEMIDLKISAD